MDFIIKHLRDGIPVGVPDRAITMYAARSSAHARQSELQSDTAIIIGETVAGDEREVESIAFMN